ncbi:hypothetical protein WHR41_06614 [Cladosporium halotolerans]|uniref:Developmental regulatory protein wetA n=1 Tax=Cladosporium halotolerans TaxID=1052096 RepID=A0AB34KN62_9PEZI
MASLHQQTSVPIRSSNKESDWSSFCNNVFEEYLDDDDLFAVEPRHSRDRSSSDDSGQHLFDFSGSSEQSNHTTGTSPIPSWEHAGLHTPVLEAQQPKAQESVGFWKRTLKALEQNAAESEQKQRVLRTTKSHPDFLSLGGHPSPPAIPSSPTDQSLSVQRRRVSRPGAANGNKPSTASAIRSVSRGRPTGVCKTTSVAGAANPYATVRKVSTSPHKMMTPSRYRAGFKDVWAEKIEQSGDRDKYHLHMPSRAHDHPTFPASPPPSARMSQDAFSAFGSPLAPTQLAPLPAYDPELSPLTDCFQQQARIHTPIASPLFEPQDDTPYFDAVPAVPSVPVDPYALHAVPLNDTSPVFPDRTSSLVANRIGFFDFGFGSTTTGVDSWAPDALSPPPTTQYFHDPFAGLPHAVLPTTEHHEPLVTGLGISCDPSLVSAPPHATADFAPLPPIDYQTMPLPHGLPTTPHRRSRLRSDSPSPPLTEPRSARRATRGPSGSRSRCTSRHRRAKSTNSTPRHPPAAEKSGFVNFTPHDSTKILSGVAPSGSSKTKARREKEAADKRRRLSQAAVRAVVEAGGDLDGLAKAGLLA